MCRYTPRISHSKMPTVRPWPDVAGALDDSLDAIATEGNSEETS
jgi:hypothetical protein